MGGGGGGGEVAKAGVIERVGVCFASLRFN